MPVPLATTLGADYSDELPRRESEVTGPDAHAACTDARPVEAVKPDPAPMKEPEVTELAE